MPFLNPSLLLIRLPAPSVSLVSIYLADSSLWCATLPFTFVWSGQGQLVSSCVQAEPLSSSRLLFTLKKHLQRPTGPMILKSFLGSNSVIFWTIVLGAPEGLAVGGKPPLTSQSQHCLSVMHGTSQEEART